MERQRVRGAPETELSRPDSPGNRVLAKKRKKTHKQTDILDLIQLGVGIPAREVGAKFILQKIYGGNFALALVEQAVWVRSS